ncbi:hypothetical protein SBBP2_450008 [Burkholderiales bacterium]|nr:hypothetical protein SBBP2_450008 [Burkholderiales bacterium]
MPAATPLERVSWMGEPFLAFDGGNMAATPSAAAYRTLPLIAVSVRKIPAIDYCLCDLTRGPGCTHARRAAYATVSGLLRPRGSAS